MANKDRKVLVTGAVGQVGTELVPALRERYGAENVAAAGHRTLPDEAFRSAGPFVTVDATGKDALRALIRRFDIALSITLRRFSPPTVNETRSGPGASTSAVSRTSSTRASSSR